MYKPTSKTWELEKWKCYPWGVVFVVFILKVDIQSQGCNSNFKAIICHFLGKGTLYYLFVTEQDY